MMFRRIGRAGLSRVIIWIESMLLFLVRLGHIDRSCRLYFDGGRRLN